MGIAKKTKARQLRARQLYRKGKASIAEIAALTGWRQSEVYKLVKDIKRSK